MALLDGFPIRELTGLLCDNDADDSRQSYERLSFGVGTSFKDDGAENEVGKVDITTLLRLHETYHRGRSRSRNISTHELMPAKVNLLAAPLGHEIKLRRPDGKQAARRQRRAAP
jgi:hypothetical protein